MQRLLSGAAIDKPEITNTTLPPIPEIVRQQPQQTHLLIIHENSTPETHKNSHTPEFKQRNDVKSQSLPIRETSHQVSGSGTEPFPENQNGSTPVQCLNEAQKSQP